MENTQKRISEINEKLLSVKVGSDEQLLLLNELDELQKKEKENPKEEKNQLDILNQQPVHQAKVVTSVFNDKAVFEHNQRVAMMLSKSGLIPKDYSNNIPNCMIALEMATRMGASPLMIMQNLYIVHGRPAWSSQFLIATLNASGRFTSLRYEDGKEDGGRCRAFATDKATNEVCYGTWVSMKMAEAEGWVSKNGSKWKTMPELMMRYRAAAFFTRQFSPELSMGIITSEEAHDIGVQKKTIHEDWKQD